MQTFTSIQFIDFSLGPNVGTVEEVMSSFQAAKEDIQAKLEALLTPSQIAKTAWTEVREGNFKRIVVKLPESTQELYSVFADQFENSN